MGGFRFPRAELLAGALIATLTAGWAAAQSLPAGTASPDGHAHEFFEREVVQIMSKTRIPTNRHLKRTALRRSNEADRRHAAEIVLQMRAALEDFKDYRVAEQAGYQIFFPGLDLPRTHFANDRAGLIGSLWFRPSKPTTLLYRKTRKGYELVGALYTASQFASESELNRRVPLSVARWHAHVNICMPPEQSSIASDWKKFGFEGSIDSEEECQKANGNFYPQMFGWMLRVFPFEKSFDKIWEQ